MKFTRIYALLLRFFFLFYHSWDRFSDAFYWPTIDLLLWGLTSAFLKTYAPNASQIIITVLSGIIFWLVVWRSQYEISVNLLEELWNKNLINLFVSPLTLFEWIISLLILGILKIIVSLPFTMVVAYILYRVKFFFYGVYFIPFVVLLVMTGWWVGFLVAGLIFRYGTKVQTLAWATIGIISPFSAVYYPVSLLPIWAQNIAALLPTSYVFEGAREVINKGYLDPNKLLISFVLNLIYLILTLIFLRSSFKKILQKGLVKVH